MPWQLVQRSYLGQLENCTQHQVSASCFDLRIVLYFVCSPPLQHNWNQKEGCKNFDTLMELKAKKKAKLDHNTTEIVLLESTEQPGGAFGINGRAGKLKI